MSKRIERITDFRSYEVMVPGSKSIGLRQLVMSAYAMETSILRGLPQCDDVDAMIECLKQLGTSFKGNPYQELEIYPSFDRLNDRVLNVRQSGVSLRFLLATASLRTGQTHFEGHPSLAARPNGELLQALESAGCKVSSNEGKLPITIQGPINSDRIEIDASRSSQYASALLLIAPLMASGSNICVNENTTSRSYLEITLSEMRKRGIEFTSSIDQQTKQTCYQIPNQPYSHVDERIEGDASAATYHMALATLHGGQVELSNVGTATQQSDYEFSGVCEQLGAHVTRGEQTTKIIGPNSLNQSQDMSINMSEMPDAALTLMALAPYLNHPIEITGLHTLPLKECNRIECPATELRRAGIRVETTDDSMKIWPALPKPAEFRTYDDHRVAMAFTVLATKATGCRIENPACVNKTYTQFWEDLSLAYA